MIYFIRCCKEANRNIFNVASPKWENNFKQFALKFKHDPFDWNESITI